MIFIRDIPRRHKRYIVAVIDGNCYRYVCSYNSRNKALDVAQKVEGHVRVEDSWA